ncbi:MAG: hypothetical protein ACI35S_06225 [Anaeroplasma sp.]
MKLIKRFVLFSLTLMFLLFISFSTHASSIEVILQQQESSDLNMIRYVGKISGLEYTEIKDYSVTIVMYSPDGTKINENTKSYTTLYTKVKDIAEIQEDKVYYAVFTLSGLNSYSEYRLDCYFTFNLFDGTKYQTNHKYYEIGTKYSVSYSSYAGYTEGCYMEFNPYNNITDSTKYVAEYRSIDSNVFTKIDNELIRYNDGQFRVDYVGLKEGKYVIRVYTKINGIKYTSDEVEVLVTSDDRSGYAHFNYKSGVGAYNDDGTLKNDALVVYVNDNNKNNVQLTYGSKTYTGLGNILANVSNISVPLDIRIIGTISTTQWNKITYSSAAKSEALINEQMATVGNVTNKTFADTIIANGWNSYSDDLASGITTLEGLTSYFTYDEQSASATGYEYDSCWNMMNISNGKNITVEGIGTDAGIFQWGFVWKKCNSIEVKNLKFDDYTEDACSFESSSLQATEADTSKDLSIFNSGNLWIHNCTFEEGLNNWDLSCEKDKGEGDGSTDIKYVRNVTISYNKYVQTHKTGLVGGGNNHLQANITFHHNFYDGCQSRMPYARQANMHIYNNYYKNSTGTTMQIYAGAYAFIEGCYFQNDNKAFELSDKGYKTPAIKSFNNIFDGSKTTSPATVVVDREALVTNGNLFNQNFDTDSDFFYYDSENNRSDVKLLETAEEAKNTCIKYSGVLTASHYNSLIEEEAEQPSTPNIEIIHNFTESGKTSDFFTISGNLSTSKGSVSYNDLTLTQCLKIESSTSISFTSENNCTLILVFVEPSATIKIDGTKYTSSGDGTITVDLSSGTHTITKADMVNLFYIVVKM